MTEVMFEIVDFEEGPVLGPYLTYDEAKDVLDREIERTGRNLTINTISK